MPWDMFSNFDDADMRALIAYLRTLPPSTNQRFRVYHRVPIIPQRSHGPSTCRGFCRALQIGSWVIVRDADRLIHATRTRDSYWRAISSSSSGPRIFIIGESLRSHCTPAPHCVLINKDAVMVQPSIEAMNGLAINADTFPRLAVKVPAVKRTDQQVSFQTTAHKPTGPDEDSALPECEGIINAQDQQIDVGHPRSNRTPVYKLTPDRHLHRTLLAGFSSRNSIVEKDQGTDGQQESSAALRSDAWLSSSSRICA